MAKLTPVLDYNDTKNKGNIKGYKVALQKSSVENISKLSKDDDVDISYEEGKIVITKRK